MLRKVILCSPRQLGTIRVPNAKLYVGNSLYKKEDKGRSTSKEGECITLKEPKCAPRKHPCGEQEAPPKPRISSCGNKKQKDSARAEPAQSTKGTKKSKRPKFQSMWEYQGTPTKEQKYLWTFPESCCPKCDNTPFDVLYYRPSNKCRKYQRTWWECCPKMVPKRVCCWCDSTPPENLPRTTSICSESACKSGAGSECKNINVGSCPRTTLPCCRASRLPPSCDIVRRPIDCEKVKCPYPSYSECKQLKPALLPIRPPECRCLLLSSTCDANRADIRKKAINSKFCECPTCK